jgi:molybdopterin-guanine dinucleotide biosynthesis protein A
MVAANQIEIAILAGGQSRRMGQDKSFVMFKGKPLIEHVIDRLQILNLNMMIITNSPTKYAHLGLPIFADEITGCGSLGGIYTALRKSTSKYVICVACDMPFLNPTLLHYQIELCGNFDAVIPKINGKIHNLHALYARRCHSHIRQQIETGNFRISDFYKELSIRYVNDTELQVFDPGFLSYANLNTLDDVIMMSRKA